MKLAQLVLIAIGITLATTLGEGTITLSEQEIREIGPLPGDKVAETLKKGERNPFSEKVTTVASAVDSESESAKLSRILNSIPITGLAQDQEGHHKVMIGRYLLSEGDRMPQLLKDQTSLLRVSKITDKIVEISWVESQVSQSPQKVSRKLRVGQPVIEQILLPYGKSDKDGAATPISIYVTASGNRLRDEEANPTPPDTEEPDATIKAPRKPDINHRGTKAHDRLNRPKNR